MTAEGGYSPKDGVELAWGIAAGKRARGENDSQGVSLPFAWLRAFGAPREEGGKEERNAGPYRAMPKRAAIQMVSR